MVRFIQRMMSNVSPEQLIMFWICLGIAPFIALGRPIGDPDLFWHLAAGRSGELLRVDSFSFSAPNAPWTNHSWLWQCIAWKLFSYGSYRALLLFSALLLILIFWLLAVNSSRSAANMESWLFPTIAAGFVIAPYADPRAQVLGHLLFAILLFQLPFTGFKRISPVWIFLLFVFWANVHSSVVVGLLWVFVMWLEEESPKRAKGSEKIREIRYVLVAAMTGSLITPWGIYLWFYPITATNHPFTSRMVAEFQPLFPKAWPLTCSLIFLMVCSLILPFFTRSLTRPIQWMLTLCVGWAALRSAVYAPFFVLLAAPQASLQLQTCFDYFRNRKPTGTSPSSLRLMAWESPFYALLLMGLFPVLSNMLPRVIPPEDPVDTHIFPVLSAQRMEEQKIEGRLFNPYNWGGYLIFTQSPRMKVYVDGRAETVYPLSVLDGCEKAESGDPKFIKSMARQADWALWPPNHVTTQALSESDDWEMAFAAEDGILFRSKHYEHSHH